MINSTVPSLTPIAPRMVTTNASYPRHAFSSALTPATMEHYEYLYKAGITTASICLHISHHNNYKFASLHTGIARASRLLTHAYMLTDLSDPIDDVIAFTRRFNQLGYHYSSKITIWCNSDQFITDPEDKIMKIIDLLSNYHDRNCIDVAFFKQDLDAGIYDLSKLPELLNLTISNCDADGAGIATAGTWIYTSNFSNTVQLLAYDYYGYYTDTVGYQLSLVDSNYVVQRGDTWISIAKRHGIPVVDLLAMNRAKIDERIYAGQVVKIA